MFVAKTVVESWLPSSKRKLQITVADAKCKLLVSKYEISKERKVIDVNNRSSYMDSSTKNCLVRVMLGLGPCVTGQANILSMINNVLEF